MDRSNGNVSLRQVAEDDMSFLFRLFVDPSRCHLWMQGRQVYDERDFHGAWSSWTAGMMGAKFIVQRGGRPIGLVFEYNRSLEDGYTKVTALLDENTVGQGSGLLAATMLVDWLFQTIPVRKVYLEVYGYNPRVIRMLRKLGVREEAVLPEHRYWGGRYWDLHTFAALRTDAPRIRGRLKRDRQSTPASQPVRHAARPAAVADHFGGRMDHSHSASDQPVLVATS